MMGEIERVGDRGIFSDEFKTRSGRSCGVFKLNEINSHESDRLNAR